MHVEIYDTDRYSEASGSRGTLLAEVEINDEALKMVRASFNPSKMDDVLAVKLFAAALISHCENVGQDERLTAIARSAAEKAAMYGVKSATAHLEDA